MALVKSALAATRHLCMRSMTMLPKRRFGNSSCGDIEDGMEKRDTHREDSLLYRFRRKRGIALSVTDITRSEWCEKRMELILLVGSRNPTKVMRAGSERHAILDKAPPVECEKVFVETVEDAWAMKILNFMIGVNQLLSKGITRELPFGNHPIFIETKTRVQNDIPSESQQRNGRLQLMCYKYLWDNLVSGNFQSRQLFDDFSLNRNSILSEAIRAKSAKKGLAAETLDDLMRYFQDSCSKLLPADDKLVLRYEMQKGHRFISEEEFEYDPNWVKAQINSILEFWHSEREAKCVSEEERWKCKYCGYFRKCPINPKLKKVLGKKITLKKKN